MSLGFGPGATEWQPRPQVPLEPRLSHLEPLTAPPGCARDQMRCLARRMAHRQNTERVMIRVVLIMQNIRLQHRGAEAWLSPEGREEVSGQQRASTAPGGVARGQRMPRPERKQRTGTWTGDLAMASNTQGGLWGVPSHPLPSARPHPGVCTTGTTFQLPTNFAAGETEAQRTGVTCPRTHTYFLTVPGLNPRSPGSEGNDPPLSLGHYPRQRQFFLSFLFYLPALSNSTQSAGPGAPRMA